MFIRITYSLILDPLGAVSTVYM